MQDMVHSTRDPYDHETRRQRDLLRRAPRPASTPSPSPSTPTGQTVERLLTPLEACDIFAAEATTPTAPLRDDHFDREAELIQGPLTTEMVAAGNLKGIRKWAGRATRRHHLLQPKPATHSTP